MTDDLIEFLRDRLNEEAALARRASHGGPGRWFRNDEDPGSGAVLAEKPGDSWGEIVVYDEGSPTPDQAAHIIRHDPARVLRDIEAKRQIVGALENAETSLRNTAAGTDVRELMTGAANSLRHVVRLLAQPYADHPEYRQEWRP